MGQVKVLGVWRSPFSWRVEAALKLKGVEYEFVEEDLPNKSEQLLKYNPIHKKAPVFVHDEKPIAESLVIMEYIDETWKDHPLLPTDPYERAQVRFWANFVDEKIFPAVRSVLLGKEGTTKATEELYELLKTFENEIKGKKYLGGNELGYLDLVALFVPYWIPILQEVVGKEVLTREKFPEIYAWGDGLLSNNFIRDNLPNKEKLVAVFCDVCTSLGIITPTNYTLRDIVLSTFIVMKSKVDPMIEELINTGIALGSNHYIPYPL